MLELPTMAAGLLSGACSVRSLHVLGKQDTVVDGSASRDLLALFHDAKVLEHPGGHSIPATDDFREAILDILAGLSKKTTSDNQSCEASPIAEAQSSRIDRIAELSDKAANASSPPCSTAGIDDDVTE